MSVKRLIYKDVEGAGKRIEAIIDSEFNMVEFKKLAGQHMIASEPWIQFAPKEWQEAMEKLFTEMVDAWNDKHATDYSTIVTDNKPS